MSTEPTTTQEPSTQANAPAELGELSFSDYVMVRRGEKAPESKPVQSAPAAKADEADGEQEQKKSGESDTLETEAKEEQDDETSESKADEADDKEDETEKEKPKKARSGGWQKRIDKKTREAAEARREAEYWKAQALKGAAGDQKPKSQESDAPKTEAKDGRPKADDYDSHDAYVEALADWKVEQRLKAEKAEEQKTQLQKEFESKLQSFREKAKSFAESHDDYEDVLESVDHIPVSPAVHDSIMSVGPEMAYELAKLGEEEFARINSLPPIAAAREIGKIEAKLAAKASEATKKPEPKKITQAPKPLEPVGKGTATVRKSIDDPDIPFEDYVRLRREQERRKRGA